MMSLNIHFYTMLIRKNFYKLRNLVINLVSINNCANLITLLYECNLCFHLRKLYYLKMFT